MPNFGKTNFLVKEESFNKGIVIEFLSALCPQEKDSIKNIIQVEIFITDSDDIIIQHQYLGTQYPPQITTTFSVLTGEEAKAFIAKMTEELEKRTKNMELLSKKCLTKSAPPPEINLPNKQANADV